MSDPPSRTGDTAPGLAQPRRLNRSQPVMHIVQQVHILTDLLPQLLEQLRCKSRYCSVDHSILARQPALRRLIQLAASAHHRSRQLLASRLRANGKISLTHVLLHRVDRLRDVRSIRMRVHHPPVGTLRPSRLYTGVFSALPLMSHSAMSTAAIAVIVTGPRRQYAPRYRYCQMSSICDGSRPMRQGIRCSSGTPPPPTRDRSASHRRARESLHRSRSSA